MEAYGNMFKPAFFTERFLRLLELQQLGNRAGFREAFKELLPDIQKYIKKRLAMEVRKGKLPAGKYAPEDFIDELYILAYEHIERVEHEDNFREWIFSKMDTLLEDTETDEEFDNYYYKNIDEYTKAEWEEMEEDFSTDGDGDLMLLEEMDDISYNKNDYILNKIFIEDGEGEIIETINQKLSDKIIQNHLEMALSKMPLPAQIAFDLSVNWRFKPEEIASIRSITLAEVDDLLDQALTGLRQSLKNRFSI